MRLRPGIGKVPCGQSNPSPAGEEPTILQGTSVAPAAKWPPALGGPRGPVVLTLASLPRGCRFKPRLGLGELSTGQWCWIPQLAFSAQALIGTTAWASPLYKPRWKFLSFFACLCFCLTRPRRVVCAQGVRSLETDLGHLDKRSDTAPSLRRSCCSARVRVGQMVESGRPREVRREFCGHLRYAPNGGEQGSRLLAALTVFCAWPSRSSKCSCVA